MLLNELSRQKGGLLLSVLMLKDAGRNCYPVAADTFTLTDLLRFAGVL